jgi:hypothetical protein
MATKKARKSLKKGKKLSGTTLKRSTLQRMTLQRRAHGGRRGGFWE